MKKLSAVVILGKMSELTVSAARVDEIMNMQVTGYWFGMLLESSHEEINELGELLLVNCKQTLVRV
jgi:hypothetical protein